MNNTFKYFKEAKDIEEAKKLYKKLAFLHHPDRGGDIEIMKAVNNEYELIVNILAENKEEEKAAAAEVEKFKDIINKIIGLDGIIIEVVGSWVWVSGDTKPHKDTIKAAGFFWAAKKQKWYYRPEEEKGRSSRGRKSYQEIKEKYGSTTVKGNAENTKKKDTKKGPNKPKGLK